MTLRNLFAIGLTALAIAGCGNSQDTKDYAGKPETRQIQRQPNDYDYNYVDSDTTIHVEDMPEISRPLFGLALRERNKGEGYIDLDGTYFHVIVRKFDNGGIHYILRSGLGDQPVGEVQ